MKSIRILLFNMHSTDNLLSTKDTAFHLNELCKGRGITKKATFSTLWTVSNKLSETILLSLFADYDGQILIRQFQGGPD